MGEITKQNITCPHSSEITYTYTLYNNVTLSLCDACNLNLASSVMSQVAIHTFADDLKECNDRGRM